MLVLKFWLWISCCQAEAVAVLEVQAQEAVFLLVAVVLAVL
jgi:hypothetical protein